MIWVTLETKIRMQVRSESNRGRRGYNLWVGKGRGRVTMGVMGRRVSSIPSCRHVLRIMVGSPVTSVRGKEVRRRWGTRPWVAVH